MNVKYFYFLQIILLGFIGNSQVIEGKVVGITDGDTFKLLEKDSILHRVRIANIDCPERKQAFSNKSKQFTSIALFDNFIKISPIKKDRYGRLISEVYYNDSLNLSRELVKNGLAWHYVKYSNDTTLTKLELIARKNKVGLWSVNSPNPPWEWRKGKRQ